MTKLTPVEKIYIRFYRNITNFLKMYKGKTTFLATFFPTLILYISLYIFLNKNISKKYQKIILSLLPAIAIVLNVIFSSTCIFSSMASGMILGLFVILIYILFKEKQKKLIPFVIIILVVSLFALNFFINSNPHWISNEALIDYDAKSYTNKWGGEYRKLDQGRELDPKDYMTHFVGSGSATIENGIMKLSGRQPRLYVGVDWQSAEMELDFKDGEEGRGCVIGIRSDVNGHGSKPGSAHTYYFSFSKKNKLTFLKERDHGSPTAFHGDRVSLKTIDYTLSPDKWYHIKYRCYNIGNTRTKLQAFIDGNKVMELIDEGDVECYNARGVVFIRNSYVESAFYKNFRASEIDYSEIKDEDHSGVEVILRKDQVNDNAAQLEKMIANNDSRLN